MQFYALEQLGEMHDGYRKSFHVGGQDLLLVQNEGEAFLICNRCPHMDAPLTRATLEPGSIRCPAHGIAFDLTSGEAKGALAGCLDPLKKYTIAYEGNTLGVML